MPRNVWEWNQDCYIENYAGAPTDGSLQESITDNDCLRHVVRGEAWSSEEQSLRSAYRFGSKPVHPRYYNIGFSAR
jgi:formylglycine-generating enzyme required for sulfatase activity